MSKIKLTLLTLYGTVYSGEVDFVTAPTTSGDITVLPSHAKLLTQLDYGDLRVQTGGDVLHFSLTGGFLDVDDDKITVFVDAAERDQSIDLERAERALARAQERIDSVKSDVDKQRAIRALHRAKIRIKLARSRRPRRTDDKAPQSSAASQS